MQKLEIYQRNYSENRGMVWVEKNLKAQPVPLDQIAPSSIRTNQKDALK